MDMKIAKYNRIRRLILEHLAPSHPHPVDSVMLRASLANLGYPMDDKSLESYLAYLAERGYLKTIEKKEFGIILVSITAGGLDALDGRITDPGIGLEA